MSAVAGMPDATWPGELIDRLWRARPARDELALLGDQIAAADFHRSEGARLAELDPVLPDDAEW